MHYISYSELSPNPFDGEKVHEVFYGKGEVGDGEDYDYLEGIVKYLSIPRYCIIYFVALTQKDVYFGYIIRIDNYFPN